MHKILFYNKFIIFLYMFRALCAHHQGVKIVLYSIGYRHNETREWSKITKIQFYKYEHIVVKFMYEFFGCDYCVLLNLLTPNVDYSGRTAQLTSKCCILYIYSTNIGTENFKHGIYSPFFPLKNAVCFINLTYLVPALFTFYIQGVLKLKK